MNYLITYFLIGLFSYCILRALAREEWIEGFVMQKREIGRSFYTPLLLSFILAWPLFNLAAIIKLITD